jgi:hypothetical protein
MFNLIVAVISIALIAAMAVASIYYGGDSFGRSSARAEAATLINQAQQIAGAATLFRIDNSASNVASSEPACGLSWAGEPGGDLSACAVNRLVAGQYLQAIPSFQADLAVQPDQVTLVEGAFGEPAGTFRWMSQWTVSGEGDLARIFLNETTRDAICAEVVRQGGEGRIDMSDLNLAGFELDDPETAPFRCVDLDLGGGEIVTAFGYRL